MLLHSDTSNNKALVSIYKKAVSEAVELYIFSAYLTHWDVKDKLNSKLQEFKFIFGQDLGLFRKEAIRKALKWLPSHLRFTLMVTQGIQGFHPKAMFRKNDKNEYHILIGSSNLTHAVFNSNYEANILTKISEQDFIKVKSWANETAMKSIPVSEDWLKGYKEARINYRRSISNRSAIGGLSLKMLPYGHELTKARREQMRKHQIVRGELKNPTNRCANGEVGNDDFYVEFNRLWSRESKNKGKGIGDCFRNRTWTRRGKSLDLRKLCCVIQAVFDVPSADKDNIVAKRIDWLKECKVPVRRSVSSEMFRRGYPDKCPLPNESIEEPLRDKDNKFRSAHGASEDSKYIDLSMKLGAVLVGQSKVKSLAKLDVLI